MTLISQCNVSGNAEFVSFRATERYDLEFVLTDSYGIIEIWCSLNCEDAITYMNTHTQNFVSAWSFIWGLILVSFMFYILQPWWKHWKAWIK